MLGLLNREQVKDLINREIKSLRDEFENRMRQTPMNADELARKALAKIVEQVNPREFLENLLATKGLTTEGLVREAVKDHLNEQSRTLEDDLTENITEQLTDKAWDELDLDGLYQTVAEKVALRLFEDKSIKEELLEQVTERLSEDAWGDFDLNEFYPVVGERVVEFLKKPEN